MQEKQDIVTNSLVSPKGMMYRMNEEGSRALAWIANYATGVFDIPPMYDGLSRIKKECGFSGTLSEAAELKELLTESLGDIVLYLENGNGDAAGKQYNGSWPTLFCSLRRDAFIIYPTEGSIISPAKWNIKEAEAINCVDATSFSDSYGRSNLELKVRFRAPNYNNAVIPIRIPFSDSQRRYHNQQH
ncbi:hypothetical protein JXB31_00690 [Candidatus Woesearchaeota archaeon]|nr:hypothetical protein [Candidatus Woesearchaeota archaeon]